MPSCIDRIQAAAEVLLAPEAATFLEALQQWRSDPEAFWAGELGQSLNDEGLDDPEKCTHQGELLLRFAQEKDYTLYLDYSGEESDQEFDYWVEMRLRALGEPGMDFGFVDDWEDELDFSDFGKGDYILEKFKLFGAYLQERGFRLIFFNEWGDSYFPFILPEATWSTVPDAVKQRPTNDEHLEFCLEDWQTLVAREG
jgi:hypothetical protein